MSETEPINLRDLVRDAHANSVSKGFHDEQGESGSVLATTRRDLARLMLITSEVAEAAEDVRVGAYALTFAPNGKPTGLPSELADVVVRVADMCGALGIDLDEAVRVKMAYNASRPHMHGKRA